MSLSGFARGVGRVFKFAVNVTSASVYACTAVFGSWVAEKSIKSAIKIDRHLLQPGEILRVPHGTGRWGAFWAGVANAFSRGATERFAGARVIAGDFSQGYKYRTFWARVANKFAGRSAAKAAAATTTTIGNIWRWAEKKTAAVDAGIAVVAPKVAKDPTVKIAGAVEATKIAAEAVAKAKAKAAAATITADKANAFVAAEPDLAVKAVKAKARAVRVCTDAAKYADAAAKAALLAGNLSKVAADFTLDAGFLAVDVSKDAHAKATEAARTMPSTRVDFSYGKGEAPVEPKAVVVGSLYPGH